MKGYCKYCENEVDETQQVSGICPDCMNDFLKYPVLFSDLDIQSRDILITEICERILSIENSDKKVKEFNLMRDSYIQASNILEEVHFKVDKMQLNINILREMIDSMKAIFQKGWGVPK